MNKVADLSDVMPEGADLYNVIAECTVKLYISEESRVVARTKAGLHNPLPVISMHKNSFISLF
jgi:hypothetical protein